MRPVVDNISLICSNYPPKREICQDIWRKFRTRPDSIVIFVRFRIRSDNRLNPGADCFEPFHASDCQRIFRNTKQGFSDLAMKGYW